MEKLRILVFCDSYLPGYTSGGAMRMVLNIVDRFYDRYEFYVVTRNYDSKSNRAPYADITPGEWNVVGNSNVFYLADDQLRTGIFKSLIRDVHPSLILLNSSFSTPAVIFLWGRLIGNSSGIPVIVSPCGSLAPACLAIKPFKKGIFIALAKVIGLYRGVIWKASFEQERHEINQAIGSSAEIIVAPDLSPASILPGFKISDKPIKVPGSVEFVYFSRVERKKNLGFLLRCLTKVSDADIHLTIIGPVDEEDYWAECLEIVNELPSNVKVDYLGARSQDEALRIMTKSHFFVLPTKNENFGYVFIESMAAGCPNLTSDQTVWSDLETNDAGWRLPLDNIELWVKKIRECGAMENETFLRMSASTRNYAVNWLKHSENEGKTEKLLKLAIASATRAGSSRSSRVQSQVGSIEKKEIGRR